jgi:hypothetical protein
MPKIHGKLARVYISGIDASNFFTSAETADQVDTAESSGFGDNDKTYLIGMRTGNIRMSGFYDSGNATGNVDATIRAGLGLDGTQSPIVNITRGTAMNDMGDGGVDDLYTSYSPSAPIGGAVAISVDIQASRGLNFHRTVLPKGTLGTSTSPGGTTNAWNGSVQTVQGGRGFLQVFQVIGGNPVYSIEHSADGSTGWTVKASFAAASAVGAQVVDISGTIQPFQRVSVTGGTAVVWVGLYQPVA